MSTTARIDCTGNNNMMQILGYDATAGVLGPVSHVYDFYEGDNARLNNIQNVLVLASFVSGSYQNAQAKNVLASVTPDVAPYSNILYRPNMSIWVPVTQNILDTITFQLVDQDSNPLNLGVHDALVVNKVKKHLVETFNPIKDLIYDIQLLKLWQLYKKLQDNNVNVYGIKTDCLLVREDEHVLNDIFHLIKTLAVLNLNLVRTQSIKNYDGCK